MTDYQVTPDELDSAAVTVAAEASTLGTAAGQVAPPSAQACGQLLGNAFSITFPAATDAAKEFTTSLGEAVDSIASRLRESATLYRQAEDEAITRATSITQANGIWEG